MSHHPRIKSFEKAPELNQKTKDSLHNEAALRGKPFFSPKYGVNVDHEDGVLVNRPVYTDGTKLTYEIADKPFRSNSSNHFSTPFMAKSPLKDAKFLTPAQPPVMDPERNIDMTEQEKFLFDLWGYVVIKNVLNEDEVASANVATDHHQITNRPTGLAQNSSALKAENGRGEFQRNPLTFEHPYCQPFRHMLVHPKVISILNEILGVGFEVIDNDNDFYYEAFASSGDYRRQWKDFNLHLTFEKKLNKIWLSTSFILNRSLNYQWELDDNIQPYYHAGNDKNNFYSTIKVSYFFGK